MRESVVFQDILKQGVLVTIYRQLPHKFLVFPDLTDGLLEGAIALLISS